MTTDFTITRILDAPRDLVFRMWTEPAHATCWFGPHGITTPLSTIVMDVRPGGEWRVCMVNDDGGERYPTGGVYREVVAPERLVFTWGVDGQGADRDESLVTITFDDVDGKTRMTLTHSRFTTDEERAAVKDGWTQTVECLAAYLKQF